MGNGTDNVPSGCCSRRWGSSLGLLDSFLGADKSNTAVCAVAERLYHRGAAPTQRDPRITLWSGLSPALRDGNRIPLVIDECYVAVHSVGSVLTNLDPDFCHL